MWMKAFLQNNSSLDDVINNPQYHIYWFIVTHRNINFYVLATCELTSLSSSFVHPLLSISCTCSKNIYLASYPGIQGGEGMPGTHCLHMCLIFLLLLFNNVGDVFVWVRFCWWRILVLPLLLRLFTWSIIQATNRFITNTELYSTRPSLKLNQKQ